MTTTSTAHALAKATQDDAYSFQNFGKAEWAKCAQILLDAGWDTDEAANILRSKIMRWASDEADEPFRASASDLQAFLDKYADRPSMKKAIREAAHPAA